MKISYAVENKNGRKGRISQIKDENVMVSYYNDGNAIYPPWEWLQQSELTEIDNKEVALDYVPLEDIHKWEK